MTVDLGTRYLGLQLRNPLVVSASPLSERLETMLQLQQAGAAAIVLRSLFEEQIEHESIDLHGLLEQWADSYLEAQNYFPDLHGLNTGPASYVEALKEAKEALSIPVIASLNGISRGGWIRYARLLEEAGADALELNVYFVAAGLDESSAEVENRYVELVAAVREVVSIPLAVKIGPYFSSVPHMAKRLVEAGADGLVLFNRFVQPDIDLDSLAVVPAVTLSTSDELRLPLRWIAILKGRVDASLAATTGIHTSSDALKVLLAGADVAMMASALLKNGPSHLRLVLQGVREWLEQHEYDSVEQMKGSLSQASCADPAAFERTSYMKALVSYSGWATAWRTKS